MHVCQTVVLNEVLHFGPVPLSQLGHYQLLDVHGSSALLVDGLVEGVVAELYLPEVFGVD